MGPFPFGMYTGQQGFKRHLRGHQERLRMSTYNLCCLGCAQSPRFQIWQCKNNARTLLCPHRVGDMSLARRYLLINLASLIHFLTPPSRTYKTIHNYYMALWHGIQDRQARMLQYYPTHMSNFEFNTNSIMILPIVSRLLSPGLQEEGVRRKRPLFWTL